MPRRVFQRLCSLLGSWEGVFWTGLVLSASWCSFGLGLDDVGYDMKHMNEIGLF
jgi:hypothetical protein